jgi:hypothetical protein
VGAHEVLVYRGIGSKHRPAAANGNVRIVEELHTDADELKIREGSGVAGRRPAEGRHEIGNRVQGGGNAGIVRTS